MKLGLYLTSAFCYKTWSLGPKLPITLVGQIEGKKGQWSLKYFLRYGGDSLAAITQGQGRHSGQGLDSLKKADKLNCDLCMANPVQTMELTAEGPSEC